MDDFFEPLRSTKYYSSKQEETVAKYLGWGVVSGSGSRAGKPGDISGAHFLGECKTHTQPNQQLLFDKDVWKKLQNEAQSTHRFPVLVVDDGSQKINKTWCMFPIFIVPHYAKVISDSDDCKTKHLRYTIDNLESKYLEGKLQLEDSIGVIVISKKFGNETVGITTLTDFACMFGD